MSINPYQSPEDEPTPSTGHVEVYETRRYRVLVALGGFCLRLPVPATAEISAKTIEKATARFTKESTQEYGYLRVSTPIPTRAVPMKMARRLKRMVCDWSFMAESDAASSNRWTCLLEDCLSQLLSQFLGCRHTGEVLLKGLDADRRDRSILPVQHFDAGH